MNVNTSSSSGSNSMLNTANRRTNINNNKFLNIKNKFLNKVRIIIRYNTKILKNNNHNNINKINNNACL